MGRGGRREGPDLSNVSARGRSREWIRRFIQNPQSVSRWSIMPKYDLSESELNALADFILCLNFERYDIKTLSKAEASKGDVK
jgi:cbb3-type cytochrome oxidase cytochrome c subunit